MFVVKVVYKAYRFVKQNFRFSFQVVDSEGRAVERLHYRETAVGKCWTEASFEVKNPGEALQLVLAAEVKEKSAGGPNNKMFWLNIGQISIYDAAKQFSTTKADIFELQTVARKSLDTSSELRNRMVIDLHVRAVEKDGRFRPLQYIVSKASGQFVYNVYFSVFTIKNLIFNPNKSGCESFQVTALTEEGHFVKQSSDIRICRKKVLPIQFEMITV